MAVIIMHILVTCQVKDGDISKWNTYEEAYRQAEQLIEVN